MLSGDLEFQMLGTSIAIIEDGMAYPFRWTNGADIIHILEEFRSSPTTFTLPWAKVLVQWRGPSRPRS